ncbi:MAG TPA: zinc ribbon domain-containing protein [Ktedonobacterales bacterium]
MMEVIALQQHANTSDMAKTLISRSPHPPHRYGVRTLTLLCLGMLYWEIVVWGIAPLNTTFFYGTAFIVFLGVVSAILALDWRHFLSLHGNVPWATLSWPGRIGLAIGLTLVYAVFMVLLLSLPLLYLAFAVKDTIAERRTSAPALKLKTAELEASLGMLPGTDGECSHCHKPLQAGATFCAYCGMAVARKPRVCARCATVAMPDAQFCPTCGAPFPMSTPTTGA